MLISHFEWDKGNVDKNITKHSVSPEEVEEAVFDAQAKIRKTYEDRYVLFGRTQSGRLLFIVFILKYKNTLRAVSFREMTQKERRYYND